MARTEKYTDTAQSSSRRRSAGASYVQGSAVRKLEESPGRAYPERRVPSRRERVEEFPEVQVRKAVPLSRQARRNREKAEAMNRGFVMFFSGVMVMILLCSIYYLRLKADLTTRIKEVAALESEYTELKDENDAYYNEVISSVDLNEIRKTALGELEMQYPTDNQTMTYSMDGSSYVRQYQDIN
ncbi:MAG: hypothetical protein LUF78_09005 [Clostridiales bacterium]|nr:hypothetical protein [Clostridiales bacterium]